MPNAQYAPQKNRCITHATHADQNEINRFLSQKIPLHQHLDWFNPLDWIGQEPFLLEKLDQEIQSIFLAVPEVPKATWVRLFSSLDANAIEPTWQYMLEKAIEILQRLDIKIFAALGTSAEFIDLLCQEGFTEINEIVLLERQGKFQTPQIPNPEIMVQSMQVDHLPEVYAIDQQAFEPIWQNSLVGLTKAFQQRGISTVAVKSGIIVGYQISTNLGVQGHLARLAVQPEHQGQQIGSILIADLLSRFQNKKLGRVTVNTQADNAPSLAIYNKFGFRVLSERLPVFQLNL